MTGPSLSSVATTRRRATARALPQVLFAAMLLATSGVAVGQAAPEPAKKATVVFDGVAMVQAAEGNKPGEHWREFIAADEDLKSWTRLASIHEYPKIADPKTAAGNLVRTLRNQNPPVHSAILENKKTGEIIVDYIGSPADRKFVEFNLYRYSRNPKGGVIAQRYALRHYENISDFAEAFKSERQRLVRMMAARGLTVE